MNEVNLYRNIGFNALIKPLSMVLTFIYVPIVLSYIGEERYGVWATISSFVSWFGIFDIGIGNGMQNKLAESVALGNKEKSKEIVSTAYGLLIIFAIILLLTYTLVNNQINFSKLLNIELKDNNVNLAMWITVVFVCINFVLSLARTITYSIQMPSISSLISMLGQILNIILILFARKLTPANLVIIALLFGSSSAIMNIVLSILLFYNRNDLRPSVSKFRWSEIKQIGSLGLMFFIGQIGSLVMNSTDNILISKLYGAEDVTPYSSAYKLFMVFIQVQAIIIMPMWPAFTNASVKGEFRWIREKMKLMNRLAMFFSTGVILTAILIKPVIRFWLQRNLNLDTPMIWIMACYFIVYLYASNYASLLCGLGIIRTYSIMAFISAILNIPLSILFALKLSMGISGIILGTLVSQLPSLFILKIIANRVTNNNIEIIIK